MYMHIHVYICECTDLMNGGGTTGSTDPWLMSVHHVTSPLPTSTTLTISHIRIFNLLQHRGPHGCVALLVLVYFLGAEVEPLADAAGALVRFRSGLVVFRLPEAFGGHAGGVGAGVCVRRWLE